jgi:hypothetical protein
MVWKIRSKKKKIEGKRIPTIRYQILKKKEKRKNIAKQKQIRSLWEKQKT